MERPAKKQCTICLITKPREQFYRASAATDGLQARCKECHLQRVRSYRQRLKERNASRRIDPAAAKRCPRCDSQKNVTEFYRNASTPDGLHWVCRDCSRQPTSTREGIERRRRFRIYDITSGEVDALLAAQTSACAICLKAFEQANFNIDHCHETRTVRGLLCRNCNTALGLLNDDPQRLETAIRYLAKPPMDAIRRSSSIDRTGS